MPFTLTEKTVWFLQYFGVKLLESHARDVTQNKEKSTKAEIEKEQKTKGGLRK